MKWTPWLLPTILLLVSMPDCDECRRDRDGIATATPTAVPIVVVPWEVDCSDELKENGYLFQDYCVPGAETYEASRFNHPGIFGGAMTSYAAGVMERVASNRGYGLGGYKGGVALMGCGDIGESAYIRRPGRGWDGPFLVVDCSSRWGVFHNIMVKGLAVEVDYETAQRWHAATLPWVDVRIEGRPGGWEGMPLSWWYEQNALAFSWRPLMNPTATPTAVPRH